MGANAFEYNVKLNLNAETKMARAQIGELQKELQSISQLKINTAGIDKLTSEIHEASNAALTLQANLQSALNPDTGNLDFSKFISSINKSGNSVNDLAESLLKVGPQGSKAFMSLADSISRAEIPLTRTNKLINGLWDNLKKTAGWQVSSSVIHGIMGTYQQAMGYAQALDKSLTDIRIVTGQSADQMARFAKEANAAAKKLSTTTTDYTNASLIYYQQGLSDSEVKKRSDITIKMANATGTAASKVSDQLTSIWNNFDNGTKSLEHYADVMTALGAATASSTDEIAKGIQKFAAISDTVGLSYEYAASALATITATTRESADTVGNSLKTLFSRIQGLQLGETLDDGTTLNKYSTALAKVGISIKDSSGALKDMNNILDEMGSKWHTLAEDQQMALAQTVGGVRQYTQIMTLMENWDFFKENLTTANTASGALTQQAEIYAESWEAAQSRMKASMEGLWDTLIDSDSFKSLLNIGSTIVDGITDAIAGLGSTGGIITTLGGILGTVFNTQISSAIEDGIYNIGALLNPKGAKQRAIDQKREVLTRMSDSIIDQNSGLEGRTYKRVLDKQAAEMEDRERHRQMMAKENHDVDARYEEQLKEIRQREIDFARQIDQGENQFNAAMDSFDDFETAEGTEKPLKTISDAEWQNRKEQYIRAQENANKTGGKKDRAANVAKAQSDLLYAAAIMSGQNFGDGIDFTKEVQSWANRTLSQDADFNSILSQFRAGVAKRTDAEIAAGQEGGRYYKAELTTNLQKAISTLLGGDNTSQDQGIAKAYEIFDKQITDTIAGLEKKGLIDPEGKILAGHEDEVIASLSNIVETVQNDTYKFNRERILSQVRSKGGKLAIDSAYQGALMQGQGQQGFNQAEADEQRKEEDRRRLESNVAKATSIAVGAGSGLFSTVGAIQGFEGALQSNNFLGFAAGLGSGIFNLQQGRQHYADAFSKLSPFGEALQKRAQKTGLLQQQTDLQESVRSNQYWRKIEEANLEKIQKEYNQKKTKGTMVDHEYYEQEIARREASIKKRKKDEENAAGQLDNVAEGLEKLKDIDTTKFPKSMGKVGDVLDFASKNADKVAAGFQAAQMAMKLTSEGLEYIYNTNQRNATKAATSAAELENAYAMNQRNHSSLLASIDEYSQATDKLIDTNLKGAEKSAAIYEQNSIAMDLISKYNLSEEDYTRIGDTIKINEDALERAQEESIQSMSISKYAMNAAKVDAKEAQNQYQEERLEREMGYDEKVAHGIATGIAGVTGMIAGAKLGATLGSFAGPVGALIGAAAGVAIGGVVTAVTNEAKEDSIVDKAVALTRETGSTKWMDDEDALARSGLSERQLKKIKEQREEIQQLADSEYAAEQADRLEKENTAKDIIRTDEELKDFKHADKLTEGLIREQEDWYSKENMEKYNFWDTKKKKIDVAKSLEDELGLGGEQVTWEDNWRNGQLTYTTASGETGVLSYDTMAKMEATKKGKEGTDDYVDTMMDTYEAIKTATGNENAAAGMLSLLSGGDFESATVKEMEEAQKLIQDLGLQADAYGVFSPSGDQKKQLAEHLGLNIGTGAAGEINEALENYATSLGYENISDFYNTLGSAQNYSSPILNMMNEFRAKEGNEQLDAWFNTEQGQAIYGSMDQATIKEFYKELSYISATQGTDAGLKYLNGLSGILQGVEAEDMGKAVQAMLAVDWDDWDNLDTSIIDTMKEFGVTIDNDSEALKNFVTVTRATAKAIPNLEASMTSLTQAASALEGVKIGDKISDATIEALKAEGYNLDDETFSTFGGENVVIGNTEHILQGVRDEITATYGSYNETRDKVDNVFLGVGDHDEQVDALRKMNKTDFLDQYSQTWSTGDGTSYRYGDAYSMAQSILGEDGISALDDSIKQRDDALSTMAKYKTDDEGNVTEYFDGTEWQVLTADERVTHQKTYDAAKLNKDIATSAIDQSYESIMAAMDAAQDPAEIKKIAEQYVSTFSSFEDAMADRTTQEMIDRGDLSESDALMYYATKYPELTEYVNAYNDALAYGTEEAQENAEAQLKTNIAIQDGIAAYQAATGKKTDVYQMRAAGDYIKELIESSPILTQEATDEELADIASEALIAADAYSILQKNYSSWVSKLNSSEGMTADAYKAAENLGKQMQNLLGLSDHNITNQTLQDIILDFKKEFGEAGFSGIMSGDMKMVQELRKMMVLNSNAGLSRIIAEQKGTNEEAGKLEAAINTLSDLIVEGGYEAFTGTDEFSDEHRAQAKAAQQDIIENTESWEQYQSAMEAAGYSTESMSTLNVNGSNYTGQTRWSTDENGNVTQDWGYYNEAGDKLDTGVVTEIGTAVGMTPDAAGQLSRRTGRGGGGGGGPTKVGVKSAQELMTRYKVIDQKTTINDMQKTAALQAKDLLYGQSKINQLNTINTLLRKQQQLTTDRITEELDYLEKDKKKIEELIERYNKDAEDEDKINLEYDGFGIITNYKQVIGKWAEELASYYADGELTAEEGKKAEELQKKIQDFTTLIKDYEDSLNQLMTSIETFENTLYELFSNQMEALTYKVQYKIEIEQDDLSYIDFYSSSIKDSYSMMYTYLELVGSKISEMSGQMAIYQSGYEDLIAFADSDPMQLWATQGVEGILTAEQIETARSYRDSMISLYQSAVAARKEIEEQVLRTFDKWNDKINKNITDISRFTDMLAQFKDIINIVGKETLGLSDSFMKTFEQNSINQSMDNIAASKSQYENLVKTYEQSQSKLLEAQQRLEAAKASGDEGVIATAERDVEYWESIADKTQEEMQSTEDTMLTTLNHTLTMISEQFTNAITQAVDDFNDSIYQFNGLDGLEADYEQIREQQDLMVADYEKIYSLNKLNRNLEKTLDNSKLTAGRAKLLEIQKEIHDLNKSNVELSRYDLEYLQAKYDLKVAEMELDNARNTKDTVMLSKDSEGNWSYIYSQNTNVVEEAEQKVEDSLFRMQQLSQQYTEEMSAAMMSISQQMRDELAALSIQDFESEEAYYEERKRIQEKYSAQLAHREEELNKAIANNAALYDEDWANYSEMTGYKMSADQDWVDSFSETTLGGLIGSTSDISDYSMLIADSTNKMNEALSAAASTYFVNADKALKTYGSSLKTFGSTVTTTTNGIISSSEKAVKEVSTMGATLVTEFEKITDKVEEDLAKWAEDIGNTLTALLEQIEAINKKIAESASKSIPETTEMIGQEEAAELLSKETFNNAEYAGWEFDGTRAVHNGMDIVQFNGELVKDVNEALQAYANAKIGSPAREEAAKKLEEVIADYWKFKKILERIYDPTNIDIEEIETPDITEMSSGGYTGEWGNEGKYAVLHEKELVLNKDDTSNFLEALTVSKQLMELIELNARASSQGLGEMHAATIQDPLQNFEQQIQITAEFPDATDHNEIEQAFDNLINMASQYAHRYK